MYTFTDTWASAGESPSRNEQNNTSTHSVPIASGRLRRSKSLEWDCPDYDTLEPKESTHSTVPVPIRGHASTRIPIPVRTKLISEAKGEIVTQ